MTCNCKLDCVEKALSKTFSKLGRFIAFYPWPFLIIPVIVCLGLTAGIVKLEREDSTEIMYTPTDGDAKDERKLVQEYFPENDTHLFQSSRKTDLTGYMQIVFTGVPGSLNVYHPDAFEEIIVLDDYIHSTYININGEQVSYDDICAKWMSECSQNIILEIIDRNPDNLTNINLTYPVHDNRYFLGMQLGGVQFNNDDFVNYAEAVLLTYHVQYQTEEAKAKGDVWLQSFIDEMLTKGHDGFQYVVPNFETSLSMDDEIARSTGNIIPLFSIAYTILMTFAAVSTTMRDWVRCKTWVALAGEISAILAVGASMGFLSLCGVLYTSTVGTMPFLIVGIGIDNMFVLLSSWRHTNYLLPVEDRMSEAFETAAVSITLTSLTNALAFAIGSYTSFLSIQLFCAYTGLAVIFCYVNTITFFAAIMVFSGRREADNRHVFTCQKTIPLDQADDLSKCRRIFCTGGDKDMEEPDKVEKLLEKDENRTNIPFFSNFLGDSYAPFLMKAPVRIIVIIIYFVYIGFAAWGCATLQEGLELKNLAPDDSYLVPYYGNYSKYFTSEYGPRVMVVIDEPLDYSKQEVRLEVHDIIESFQNNKFFFDQPQFTESWLKDFELFLSIPPTRQPANMTEFISILRSEFFILEPFQKYVVDLNFSSDYSEIIGSRFLVQAHGIENSLQEKELVLEVRELAESATYSTTTYHAAFIFYDQYIVIISNTVRNLLMAAGCMLLVAAFLLPHPLAVLWVTASVISICFGVLGFMVFWDVNLDSISMINLIMCIGFSVDFSGHICYHFTITTGLSPIERIKEAMRFLGLPIWQGAISTILGVVVLSFSNSYIFRTFFKLIFLVVVFGFFHAMIILPVVLPTIGPGSCSKERVNSVSDLSGDDRTDMYIMDINKGEDNPGFTEIDRKQED